MTDPTPAPTPPLLPCPAGHEAAQLSQEEWTTLHSAYCPECGWQTDFYHTRRDGIFAWNRRAAPPASPAATVAAQMPECVERVMEMSTCCQHCENEEKQAVYRAVEQYFKKPAPSPPLAELDRLEALYKTAWSGEPGDGSLNRFHDAAGDAFPALAATIRAQAERVRVLTEGVNRARITFEDIALGEKGAETDAELAVKALARIQSLVVGGAGEKEQGK